MRDFFKKITATTTTKLIACIVIAVPIWLIIIFTKDSGKTEKNVDAVAVSTVASSSEVNDSDIVYPTNEDESQEKTSGDISTSTVESDSSGTNSDTNSDTSDFSGN